MPNDDGYREALPSLTNFDDFFSSLTAVVQVRSCGVL
jgi:hypothetical protein